MTKSVKELNKKTKDIKIFCDITRCIGCKSCEIACAIEHSQSKNIFSAVKLKYLPKKRVKTEKVKEGIISLHCQHCKEAPCVTTCMSGALTKDEKTGQTLHNDEKCVGCWMCVMVCPFGALTRDTQKQIAVKCDLCPDREDYACVAACPTGALFAGTKKEFEKLVKERSEKKK